MGAQKKIAWIDYLRAVCMLWIIGVWHLSEYCVYSVNHLLWATNLTTGTLGAFAFISGGVLGVKEISNPSDALAFYKIRLARIYPMFAISCISLWAVGLLNSNIRYINGIEQLIQTLFGVTIFFSPASSTVWFVSMLILFYAITPLLNLMKSTIKKAFLMVGIYAVVLCVNRLYDGIDGRLLYLMPMYFGGLLISSKLKSFYASISATLISGVTFLSLIMFATTAGCSGFVRIIINLCICVATVACGGQLCMWLERLAKKSITNTISIHKLLLNISYCSFVAYLFHRQILGAIYLVVGKFNTLIAYVLIFPLLLACSYYIQKIYDRVLKLGRKATFKE